MPVFARIGKDGMKTNADVNVKNQEFVWNLSNCEWECNKSCDIGEYLDYQNCKCKSSTVDELVEECTKIVDENKIYN